MSRMGTSTPGKAEILQAWGNARARRASVKNQAGAHAEALRAQLANYLGENAFCSLSISDGESVGANPSPMECLREGEPGHFECYVGALVFDGSARMRVAFLFEASEIGEEVVPKLAGRERDKSIVSWAETLVSAAAHRLTQAIKNAPPGPLKSAPEEREVVFEVER